MKTGVDRRRESSGGKMLGKVGEIEGMDGFIRIELIGVAIES